MTSQVHPIDNSSVPYSFSSTTCPMLHNAARALNLPGRSSQSYLSLFGLPTPVSSTNGSSIPRHSSSSTTISSANSPVLDDKYTGHIVVSGYHVSYVLPKEFPPRLKSGGSFTDHDATPMSYKMRRSSIGDKNVLQFMAAIDVWVPYVSRPPRAPYLVRKVFFFIYIIIIFISRYSCLSRFHAACPTTSGFVFSLHRPHLLHLLPSPLQKMKSALGNSHPTRTSRVRQPGVCLAQIHTTILLMTSLRTPRRWDFLTVVEYKGHSLVPNVSE
jgi:hypothetical protein